MSTQPSEDLEKRIHLWKLKRSVRQLEEAKGSGTSMITLIIPPKPNALSDARTLLTEEYGTATNIKSRVNRQSVLTAITSTQQRLKIYNRVPANGLAIFCGTIITEEGKERKVNIDLEPFKPINTKLYMCDKKFHVESIRNLLDDDDRFGFIVMDGNGSLFGTLSGNTRDVLYKYMVSLPKKHGRGGQSAARFSRLRDEARHNYVRKVAELATSYFITDNKINVKGLVLAGSADFKNDLNGSDMFDPRLSKHVINVVDVQYGMENGFNQAINLAADSLSGVKFVQEKKLLQKFLEEIAVSTVRGKVSFNVDDTLNALELSAVETLIVYENLDIMRYQLVDSKGAEHVIYSNIKNEGFSLPASLDSRWLDKERAKFMDPYTGTEMENSDDPQTLVDWLADHYQDYGATLEFVTDKSQEGSQFVQGFGGIGGLLRYEVDLQQIADALEEDDEWESDTD